jgi:hypothetical protein
MNPSNPLLAATPPTDPKVQLIAWVAGFLGVSPILVYLAWVLAPKLGGPFARSVEWVVIRFFARYPQLWHRFIRPRANRVLGKMRGVVLPDMPLSLMEMFVPIQVRLARAGGLGEVTDLGKFLAANETVILRGEAGSGKTTLATQLVLQNYRPGSVADRRAVAVLVRLREMAAADHSAEEAIEHALAALWEKSQPDGLTRRFLQPAIDTGNLLLVLDGLDEVPGEQRDEVVRRILRFARGHDNRVLLTCRTSGFRLGELDAFSTTVADVVEMSDDNIAQFLTNLPSYRGCSAVGLLAELRKPELEAVRKECRNPLFLAILAESYLASLSANVPFVWPKSRREFCEHAVAELLQGRPNYRGQTAVAATHEQKRSVLGRVARDRFGVGVSGDREKIPRRNLTDALAHTFGDKAVQDRILGELEKENGILHRLEPGGRGESYIFARRTFLEFFAAWWMADNESVELVIVRCQGREGYEDLLLWYAALAKKQDVKALVRWYADNGEWKRAAGCLVAGKEIESEDPRTSEELVRRVAEGLEGLLGPDDTPKTNSQAWGLLAALARRPERPYQPAQAKYAELLDKLVPSGTAAELAPALSSLLKANPDRFHELVPELLNHPSPDRAQAVAQLLAEEAGRYDETDPRARRAVQTLLNQFDRPAGDPTRRAAATRLCGLLAARGRLIRDLESRLPQVPVEAAAVWPLDLLFPARVVWPLVVSLADANPTDEIPNEVVRTAVQAYNERRQGGAEKVARSWAGVTGAYRTARAIGALVAGLAGACALTATVLGAAVVLAALVGFLRHCPVFLAVDSGAEVPERDDLARFERVAAAANQVQYAIGPNLPKTTRLVKRGQNWDTETVVHLQGKEDTAYKQLQRLGSLAGCVYADDFPDDEAYQFYKRMGATDEQLTALREALAAAPAAERVGKWRRSLAVPPLPILELGWWWAFPLLIVLLVSAFFAASFAVDRTVGLDGPQELLGVALAYSLVPALAGFVLVLIGGWYSGRRLEWCLIGLLTVIGVVGFALRVNFRLHWNRLVDLVPVVRAWTAKPILASGAGGGKTFPGGPAPG